MAKEMRRRKPLGIRRASYAGTIVVNAALVWAFGRLLVWDWPDFLTSEFADLVPWIRFSLVFGIVVAVARFVKDPQWFVALTECISAMVTGIVAARILHDFPFDFTAKASFWEPITRVVLILAVIGAVASMIVNLVWAIVYSLKGATASPTEEAAPPSP